MTFVAYRVCRSINVSHTLYICCQVREQVHECTVSQYNVAVNVAELYGERQQREVERFRDTLSTQHLVF